MNEKLIKICRFCLYEEKCDNANKVLDIFQSDVQDDLAFKVKKHTKIQISPSDNIPPNICMKCVDCLIKFDQFLNCCLKSEKVLKEMFGQTETISTSVEENTIHSNNESNTPNFESTSEPIEKLSNSNSYNDTINSKIEDTVSDDFSEYSDSDISSARESQTNPEVAELKMVQINDNIKNITKDKKYFCSICSEPFDTFFEYQDHREIHNKQHVFSSTKCDKVFSERKQLVEHDINRKVACQVCSKMILPRSLSAHLKKHTDLHRCPECNLSCTSKASLEKHVQARHTAEKGLVCHICGKQNSCQSSLSRHLASHSSGRPYQCKKCNFSAKTRGILQVHVSRKHFATQTSCKECGKTFKSEISLKQHVKRIHNPRKHVCQICQKAFVEKHSLDKHISKKHMNQRIYDCKVCNMEFDTVKKLKVHMLSHRPGGVSCPKCGKQFYYRKYLERHMATCGTGAEADSFKNKLCRLQSTISLPGSSMQLQKFSSFELNEL